eukprot:4053042-Alexandrium_andersonii.AAC.1
MDVDGRGKDARRPRPLRLSRPVRRTDPLDGIKQLRRSAAPGLNRCSEPPCRGPCVMGVGDLRRDHDPTGRGTLPRHLCDRLGQKADGAPAANDQSDRVGSSPLVAPAIDLLPVRLAGPTAARGAAIGRPTELPEPAQAVKVERVPAAEARPASAVLLAETDRADRA